MKRTNENRQINRMADLIFDTLIGAYDLYTFAGCKKLAEDLYNNGLAVIARRPDTTEEEVH